MIPENKQAIVRKALQLAFHVNEFEDIQQLTKGLSSALIFKIMVGGNPYLLRVITRTDGISDPAFYFACMKIAAAAGLAPRIQYLSVEDRISITDFIEEQPFSMAEAREKMPRLIQQLHSLPKFARRMNYFERMEGFMAKFRSANILPEKETKQIFEAYERIAAIYPRNEEDWVSCHNDLKPENILSDGQRPWMVDWEAAFLNDQYLDLTVVGNFVVRNENDEANYLASYFGETADDYRHARFFVMSQILHIYYFTFLMLIASEGKPVDPDKIERFEFRLFHDRMWNGEINLTTNETRIQYAWVHREQALHNMRAKRFEDSLRLVSAGQ